MWINDTTELSDFYDELVARVGTISLKIDPNTSKQHIEALVQADPHCPSPYEHPTEFKKVAFERLNSYWELMKTKVLHFLILCAVQKSLIHEQM